MDVSITPVSKVEFFIQHKVIERTFQGFSSLIIVDKKYLKIKSDTIFEIRPHENVLTPCFYHKN